MVEKQAKQETSVKVGGKQSSAYSSTLKMDAICSSETSVDFQRTARRYIPDDSTFQDHSCENLKSYIAFCLIVFSFQDMEFMLVL
jgi:hypothetical protein